MNGNIPKEKILVKEIKPQEKVVNNIIIPNGAETQKRGEVVLCGSDTETKVGDVVYYTTKARGIKVKIEGTEYTLLVEADVLYIE